MTHLHTTIAFRPQESFTLSSDVGPSPLEEMHDDRAASQAIRHPLRMRNAQETRQHQQWPHDGRKPVQDSDMIRPFYTGDIYRKIV